MSQFLGGPGLLFGAFYLVWFALGLYAFFVFVRGMRALERIPDRLQRLEQLLALRVEQSSRHDRAP